MDKLKESHSKLENFKRLVIKSVCWTLQNIGCILSRGKYRPSVPVAKKNRLSPVAVQPFQEDLKIIRFLVSEKQRGILIVAIKLNT